VQTASAGNRKTLKLNGQTYLHVTNETTWPFFPTIKVKNEDYGDPALDDAWVYVDGVWTSAVGEGTGNVMMCDKDNVPNTSGNHNCTQPKFIKELVDLETATGPRPDSGICTSTTGFDYVGEALLQDLEFTGDDGATVEGNDYMIVNMYGAGNNYCRYLCQETDRCMFYTIGNGRCYLKGAGAKKKAGKKNAKKEGGSCIPDPNTPTEPLIEDESEDPCNRYLCGKQCKGRLFTYPNRVEDLGNFTGNLNMAVPHDCGWSKSSELSDKGGCVTGSHTGPNEKKLESQTGACTEAPTAAPTPAPATEAPVLATPAPRNCRKQCAGKFDKLKRGKGKQSLAKVCGLKNCNQCVECTRPPMVNYTLYQGSSEDATDFSNCPSGCDDVESEADVYGNTTWSCLANNSGTAEQLILKTIAPPDSVAKNCAPTYYPDQPLSPRRGCPFGCIAHQPADEFDSKQDPTRTTNFVGQEVCVTAEQDNKRNRKVRQTRQLRLFGYGDVDDDEWVPTVPAALCTGPVDLGRMCMPINGMGWTWDFTTKVIKTIRKKGFWETHCQLACYDRENCGAYVYTKGTCKLFRTLPINEATAEQLVTAALDLSKKAAKKEADTGTLDNSMGMFDMIRLYKIFGMKNHGLFKATPVRGPGMPSWLKFRATGMCLSTTQQQTLMEMDTMDTAAPTPAPTATPT